MMFLCKLSSSISCWYPLVGGMVDVGRTVSSSSSMINDMIKDPLWALNLSMKEASFQSQIDIVSGGESKNQSRTADSDAPQ